MRSDILDTWWSQFRFCTRHLRPWGELFFGAIGLGGVLFAAGPFKLGVGMVAIAAPFGAAIALRTRSIRKRIAATAGCMCLGCQYDLAHAATQGERLGVCPECGEGFDLEYNKRVWRIVFEPPTE